MIDWLIDWVSELVGELMSELVSEAEADREHTDALHHITPWYLPKIINFICSVALNLRNKCTRVPLCGLDHPWRVFFRVRPGPSRQNPRAFWFYLVGCLQRQNGNPSCRFSAQGAICHNKLANFHCKNGVWLSIKHGVYYQKYLLARRQYIMPDYLIFMTYTRHFSAKSTLSRRVVSCLLVYTGGETIAQCNQCLTRDHSLSRCGACAQVLSYWKAQPHCLACLGSRIFVRTSYHIMYEVIKVGNIATQKIDKCTWSWSWI